MKLEMLPAGKGAEGSIQLDVTDHGVIKKPLKRLWICFVNAVNTMMNHGVSSKRH